MLQYQHQWELKQKEIDNLEVPKVDKNNRAKTMEEIMLHIKLVRGVRSVPLVYVVRKHIKVVHFSPGYSA